MTIGKCADVWTAMTMRHIGSFDSNAGSESPPGRRRYVGGLTLHRPGSYVVYRGKSCFCTLPRAVRGIESTRTKLRGTLNDASCSRHQRSTAAMSSIDS